MVSDYRKNTYKELDTWESLPLNPPINFYFTSAQHTVVDYLEPSTYGFLVTKTDYGNKFGVSEDLEPTRHLHLVLVLNHLLPLMVMLI